MNSTMDKYVLTLELSQTLGSKLQYSGYRNSATNRVMSQIGPLGPCVTIYRPTLRRRKQRVVRSGLSRSGQTVRHRCCLTTQNL